MIILTILSIIALILLAMAVLMVAALGAGGILIAGDWIIALCAIVWLIRRIIRNRKQN